MFRTLLSRSLAPQIPQHLTSTFAVPVSGAVSFGASRSYVTRKQTQIEKNMLKNAPIEINPRTLVPEQKVTFEARMKLRNDPLLSQLVNTIMRDGKKMQAEKFVQLALFDIRQHTNSDPYIVLSDAIELVSPFMDTKSAKQGSKVIYVPKPLNLRQRRRKAIIWLLEAASKRNERNFHMRLSGEIQAIINGTSQVLEKKLQLHKFVLANRANIRTNRGM